jgi:leader peptidase (prepilin peptidase)/N-methyltransferase
MDTILAIPLAVGLIAFFLLGVVVAAVLNLAVYRLAWRQRSISPWSRPPAEAPPRRGVDRIPVFGWWGLARESALHGRGFWIRPLVVELLTGCLFAGMYYWEVRMQAMYPIFRAGVAGRPELASGDLPTIIHAQLLAHLVLLSLMIAASLIDLDEQTIPDGITIPGTLAGLAIAAALPWSLLPAEAWLIEGLPSIEFLTFTSPAPWPAWLDTAPRMGPLAIGLACWTLWCGGILPRRWNTRHGWRMAARVFVHRLLAERLSYLVAIGWLAGAVAIALVAARGAAASWAALLTALVGVAAGGGMIWIVRVIGAATLRRESMGFGDVMLMSFIGAFIGWQGALIVFFLAPFLGLVNGVLQWILHRQPEIPYGPYLCLATFFVILKWPWLWDRGYDLFALGGLLPALLAVCFVLMGLMLWGFRTLRERGARRA